MIKKAMKIIAISIFTIIYISSFLLIIVTLSTSFQKTLNVVLEIKDGTQAQYNYIRKDILNTITSFDLPFDCEYDSESYQGYREEGELICERDFEGYEDLGLNFDKKIIGLGYSVSPQVWIPQKEITIDEHKKMQSLILNLAKKYYNKYPNKTIEVRYYNNLPDDQIGRLLIKYNKIKDK